MEHLVKDELMWKELRDVLNKSGVITSVGVHEITQKFMVEKTKEKQAVKTKIDQVPLKGNGGRRRGSVWASMKEEVKAKASPPAGSRRGSTVSIASGRNSVVSVASRGSSATSRRANVVPEKLCQILKVAEMIDNDGVSIRPNMSFNDFFSGLALESAEDKKSSSKEEEEWNMHCSLQIQEILANQKTSLKKNHKAKMDAKKKFFEESCRMEMEKNKPGAVALPRRTRAAKTA